MEAKEEEDLDSDLKREEKVNLARAVFDDNVTVLADGTSLLRVSLGSSGVGLGLEVVLLVRHGALREREK
jgi:hypothetical protein